MKEELVISIQDLPRPRSEVFPFFANPANLQRLTPPWLQFRVLTQEPLPRGENAVFEYQLRVRGLPIRWRTLIESYEEGARFVDRQIAGPYALWHHTHIFEDLPGGGTRVIDRVRYRVGWGVLGRIIAALIIRRDIERIFAYRKQTLGELFDS